MLIKGILHERTEDAPFVGALIISDDCNINCENCFNQHLKNTPSINMTATQIIETILKNPLNQGIIFGGLEWSLQPDDMIALIKLAYANGLEIMVYTGLSESAFDRKLTKVKNVPNIYIKFGKYSEYQKCRRQECGVWLSSSNQYVYHNKIEGFE
jgi:organic radical activating enzyme